MTTYHYVLRYGSVARYIATEDALTNGSILRILKPADDRSAANDHKVAFDDLVPMIVTDRTDEYHEQPQGGFRRVTVLTLKMAAKKAEEG